MDIPTDFQFSLINVRRWNYSALSHAFVESQAAESPQQVLVESQAGVAYSITVAATTESDATSSELEALLPPQDAKDTAANATNKNTNFFIFFCFFKSVILMLLSYFDAAKI